MVVETDATQLAMIGVISAGGGVKSGLASTNALGGPRPWVPPGSR